MEEEIGHIISQLVKKSSKFSWVVYCYLLILMGALTGFILNIESISLALGIDSKFEFIKFLGENIVLSVVVIFVLKLFSDSTLSQEKRRYTFYNDIYNKAYKVFETRFNNDPKNKAKYGVFSDIVIYPTNYFKNNSQHTVNVQNLTKKIVNEVDCLYIIYKVNHNEELYFSIWHSGPYISIGIMYKKEIEESISDFETSFFEGLISALNINDANNFNDLKGFDRRSSFKLLDIKYDTDELFLKDPHKKDEISRKIAHIISVGLPQFLLALGWDKRKSSRTNQTKENNIKIAS